MSFKCNKRAVAALAAITCFVIGAPSALSYQEAPVLAEMVAKGLLPPVDQRLPKNPLVLQPLNEVGRYGGTANIYDTATGFEYLSANGMITPYQFNLDLEPGLPYLFESYEHNADYTVWTFHMREGVKWSDGVDFTAWNAWDHWSLLQANPEWNTRVPPDFMGVGEDDRGKYFKVTNQPHAGIGFTLTKRVLDDYTIEVGCEPSCIDLINQLSFNGSAEPQIPGLPMHFMKQFLPAVIGEDAAQAKAEKAGFETWLQLAKFVGSFDHQSFSMQGKITVRPSVEAYLVTEKTPTRMTYERNPYFWMVDPDGNQLPYIDRIYKHIVADASAYVARTSAGDADIAAFNLLATDIPTYRKNEAQGDYTTTIWQHTGTATVMWFNMCYPEPAVRDAFRDRDFRVALQLLVNRAKINKEVFYGMAKEWRHAPKPESNPWYEEKFLTKHTEFDPETANKMLDDAGYVDTDGDGWREDPDGRQLKLASIAFYDTETPRSGPIKIIEPEWQKAGINFTFEDVGQGSGFWPLFGAGTMSFLVWHGQFTTPTTLVMRYHGTPGTNPPNCWNTWVNTKGAAGVEPPVRAWQATDYFDRARASGADPEERIRLGKLAMEIYAEDVYNIDTVTNFPHPVVTKNDLRNVPSREHGPLYFGYDALWMKAYNPMQMYFEGRPAVTMADSGLPARYDSAEMAKDPIDQMIERGEVSPGG